MPWLIGIDEAGYGPNLGPFVMTAVACRVPEALAEADLGGLGLTVARAAAIGAFARAVAGGAVRLDNGSPLDELAASIAAVPGLGPWTAQYLALRMGEPDAFPASDLGVRRALAHVLGRAVSERDAAVLAEGWRPWRAHAAIHLWLTPLS